MRSATIALLLAAPSAAAFLPVSALHRQAATLPRLHASLPRPHAPLLAAAVQLRVAPPLLAEEAPPEEIELDLGSLGRYFFAVILQLLCITTAFGFVDLACYGPLPGDVQLGGPLPWPAVVAIFLALSVRSRFFNLLNNARPELETGAKSQEDRTMPSWTPPGVVFPIMWVLPRGQSVGTVWAQCQGVTAQP